MTCCLVRFFRGSDLSFAIRSSRLVLRFCYCTVRVAQDRRNHVLRRSCAAAFPRLLWEERGDYRNRDLANARRQAARRARALVLEWAAEHRTELLEDWRLAENHQPLNDIDPLE